MMIKMLKNAYMDRRPLVTVEYLQVMNQHLSLLSTSSYILNLIRNINFQTNRKWKFVKRLSAENAITWCTAHAH